MNLDELLIELNNDIAAQPANNLHKTIFSAQELYNINLQGIPCLFGDIIPKCGIWTLVGSSDTGKSMLLRQLAIDCVKGNAFLGWANNAVHKRVLFVSTEDDVSSTSYLLRMQSPQANNLDNLQFYFDCDNVPETLHLQLQQQAADLVIIDAWSDVFGKDLKDSALIRKTLNVYKSIAGRYQCSIGFLHHTGKRTEKFAPNKNNILSGQGYEATMRLVIELRADATNPNLRHLCIVKGNYLSNDYKQSSYQLQFDAEKFLFTPTGIRIPFEQLAAYSDDGGTAQEDKQKATPFYELDDDVHEMLLKEVFEKDKELGYADLFKLLGEVYASSTGITYGRDKSKRLLTFLLSSNFITKTHGGRPLYSIAED